VTNGSAQGVPFLVADVLDPQGHAPGQAYRRTVLSPPQNPNDRARFGTRVLRMG
jgi:hypothetical protein